MTCIEGATFKSYISTMPFVRMAILAAQITSPKVTDGIGKMLTRTDVVKLQANKKNRELEEVELILKQGWDFLMSETAKPELAKLAYGKFITRCVVHLMDKVKQSREPDGFKDIPTINQLLVAEMKALQHEPKPSGSAGSKEPSDTTVQTLGDASDTVKILLFKFKHLKLNELYIHQDTFPKIFQLKSVTQDSLVFEHTSLFKATIEQLTFDHAKAKEWKPFKGKRPELYPSDWISISFTQTCVQLEVMKAAVFVDVMGCYDNVSVHSGLQFSSNPPTVFAGLQFAKYTQAHPCRHAQGQKVCG